MAGGASKRLGVGRSGGAGPTDEGGVQGGAPAGAGRGGALEGRWSVEKEHVAKDGGSRSKCSGCW